jgi:hypothetical protein
MNHRDRAIETTEQIRDALSAEIAIAREERVLIRNMDVDGLNRRAIKRADFNERTALLQKDLAAALARVAEELGVGIHDISLEMLRERAPGFGQSMSAVLAEVRSLASALSELDHLNRMLGQRARSYVRAHLAVLCPKPAAYDRRGGSAAEARPSTTIVRVL